MYKSIVVSCDTYYYVLANETDIDDTHRFMSQLGFGRKTGIDIEGELPGMLPSREWKRQRFAGKKYREEHRKWYLGDSISAGIGQGYNAFTPVQLAHAIATIANDGVAYPAAPRASASQDAKTGEARVGRAASRRTRSRSSRSTSRSSSNALVGVNKEGTSAHAFRGAHVRRAAARPAPRRCSRSRARSTCAHKVDERLRDHAWFIAYAPADKPTIALAVLVENGGFGAQAAAPIARQVFDYYLLGEDAEPGAGARRRRCRDGDDESD